MHTDAPMTRLAHYQAWLARERGLHFNDYETLWRWSVDDLRRLLGLDLGPLRARVADTVHRRAGRGPHARRALVCRRAGQLRAPGAAPRRRRPRGRAPGDRVPERAPAGSGGDQLASCAPGGRARAGDARGRRAARRPRGAWLPNTPHAIVAFLATASLGAVWSICSPDMGPVAVLDRFRQIEPGAVRRRRPDLGRHRARPPPGAARAARRLPSVRTWCCWPTSTRGRRPRAPSRGPGAGTRLGHAGGRRR
jgi:acetoacetyl-CoA synthetase